MVLVSIKICQLQYKLGWTEWEAISYLGRFYHRWPIYNRADRCIDMSQVCSRTHPCTDCTICVPRIRRCLRMCDYWCWGDSLIRKHSDTSPNNWYTVASTGPEFPHIRQYRCTFCLLDFVFWSLLCSHNGTSRCCSHKPRWQDRPEVFIYVVFISVAIIIAISLCNDTYLTLIKFTLVDILASTLGVQSVTRWTRASIAARFIAAKLIGTTVRGPQFTLINIWKIKPECSIVHQRNS